MLPFFVQSLAGVVSDCPRPEPGSAIPPPAEVRSSNGILDVQFSFRGATGSDTLHRYCYVSGRDLSPTLRVHPGDTVVLKLKNELVSGDRAGVEAMHGGGNSCSSGAMSASATNLHFHGLDIPPKCHQDDVLNTSIQPSDAPFEYRFSIPRRQPPGLYWYHPHPHGYSEQQVLGGASGALIVEGIEHAQPAVAGLPERVLILRDQSVPKQHANSGDGDDAIGKDISINYVPVRFPLYLPAMIAVKPEVKEFWRVLNASADTYFNLQVIYIQDSNRAPQNLQLIAMDGSPLPRESMAIVTGILIPPGSRAEFIVTTPPAGAFAQLVSRDYDTGRDGAKNPARVIANIVSKAAAPAMPIIRSGDAAPATSPRPLPAPVRRRKLYFSEDRQDLKDPAKPALYFITVEGKTPHVFDMHSAKPDITVEQGSVEDWLVENRATEAHVFHIHQLHFQVVRRDGGKVDEPVQRDTIDLPAWDGQSAYPSVTLRMDFRDPQIVGTFVYHCHILEHEDAGMMGSIRVVARRKRPRYIIHRGLREAGTMAAPIATTMSYQSLEEALESVGDPVELLRNSRIGPYAFPVVRHEFTNWRDEQRAWRETCALFDQSHHMTDLYVEGPEALKLFSDLGVNSFRNFRPNQGKQFVACNYDGHVIGDAILFYLDENKFNLVGRPPAANWVQYHVESGKYKATAERDERSAVNQGRRKAYRYQIQGPNALKVMEKVTGKPAPEIKFFSMDVFQVAGHDVRALRHGMVGRPGWELFGPWEQGEAVRDAIVKAGQEFGIRQVGARTYPTTCLESGWIPSPLPAIYSGDDMKGYRQWLTGKSYEAMASLGGSYYSSNIADYYLTPWDLGYGPFVKFDHDFVGRAGLEKMTGHQTRKKVTLVWNGDDFARTFGTLCHEDGEIAKYVDLPLANYATLPYDKVLQGNKTVGLSTYTGYTYNERAMISLAMIDIEHSEPGTQLMLIWGEEGGGSSKPTVERHLQAEIRVTVAPAPFAEVARTAYRPQ